MKIYLVYSRNYESILREANARILVNFATIGRRGIPFGFRDVLIDSGGYQLQVGTSTRLYAPNRLVEKSGKLVWEKTPEVGAYAFWLQQVLPQHPEVSGYFNLDILGNGLRTLENQFALEEYGLNPIPVWHFGEGEEYLQYYWENYDYISVGGLVSGTVSKTQLKLLNSLLTQKYPGKKYHYFGIGITGTSVFKESRPYSVDFSTWSNPARFGNRIVEDSKQILKEETLPEEIKERLRGKNSDRKLLENYLKESVKLIMELEEKIDSIHDPEYQIIMNI